MSSIKKDADILSMFGLTEKQILIMFSVEKLLADEDIKISKNDKETKQKWISEWATCISDYLAKSNPNEPTNFMTREEILNAICTEYSKDINNTWYYLIMLESTLFVPYTPLERNKEDDKQFKKLKYKEQTDVLKELVHTSAIMDDVFIDRFKKTYSKSISKLKGKKTKIALAVVSALAIAAITAASAGVLSGPIAVALFGPQFVGLSGAALTSACLALAGGGAIAAGGAGMTGGILVIVGGGALLGLAGGGAAVGGTVLFVTSKPQLTLTQAAQLEVVLKEIIINAQKDIKCAQSVLENYKNQIVNLHSHLAKIKLEREEDKKTITNIKKSITYMEKAYADTMKFVSSYSVGAGLQD